MNLRYLHALFSMLVGFTVALEASAYTYNYTCNGCPGKTPNPTLMARNSASIPAGSNQLADLSNAQNEWNNSGAMGGGAPLFVGNANPITDTSITIGDGQWEVALVPRAAIGGAAGRTFSLYGACFIGCNDQDEADIMIAADNTFGNPDESLWDFFTFQGAHGRETFHHEWGHALGLGHASGFTSMRSGTPLPRVGGTGTHVTPFGDERNGVRSMYGDPSTFKNLAASAARVSGAALTTTTFVGTTYFTSAPTVDMRWTVANLGTQNLTFDARIHLNTCPTCYSGGTTWFNWGGGNVTNRSQFTWSHTASIPLASFSCNTFYWVFHTADSASAHAESRESDNTTYHAITLHRTC